MHGCIETAIGAKCDGCLGMKMSVLIMFVPSIGFPATVFERGRRLRNDEHTIVSKIAGDIDDTVLEDTSCKAGRLARGLRRTEGWIRNGAIKVFEIFRKIEDIPQYPPRL